MGIDRQDIIELANKIRAMLNETTNESGGVRSYISISYNSTTNEVVIRANREGFLDMAEALLVLSEKCMVGSHCHYDESYVDSCEVAVAFSYIDAPWDTR